MRLLVTPVLLVTPGSPHSDLGERAEIKDWEPRLETVGDVTTRRDSRALQLGAPVLRPRARNQPKGVSLAEIRDL